MLAEDFNSIFEAQMHRVESILGTKADEYATEDRLHNFKVAAQLQGVSMQEALAGMMAKHTVSIYDMIYDGHDHSLEKWDEKITDHINYLFLLAAVVREDRPMNASVDGMKWSESPNAMDAIVNEANRLKTAFSKGEPVM